VTERLLVRGAWTAESAAGEIEEDAEGGTEGADEETEMAAEAAAAEGVSVFPVVEFFLPWRERKNRCCR